MKKFIILLLFLFVGFSYSQKVKRTVIIVSGYADSVNATNALLRTIDSNLDSIKARTTLGYGNLSVLVTATQLSSSSVACKTIIITNNTNGAVLYVGSDNSVTTSNGADVLHYREVSVITINNLNKVWLIGSATIDMRYRYEN